MSDQKQPEDAAMQALDDIFAEARETGRAAMPQTLVDQIAHDALLARRAPVQVSLWAQIENSLGGWPSLSGLATAALAGLYFGFTNPAFLIVVGLDMNDAELTEVSLDLLPGDDVFFGIDPSEEG